MYVVNWDIRSLIFLFQIKFRDVRIVGIDGFDYTDYFFITNSRLDYMEEACDRNPKYEKGLRIPPECRYCKKHTYLNSYRSHCNSKYLSNFASR